MKGVHEDKQHSLRRADGSQYFYATYRVGSIVRLGEYWGVVTASRGRYDYAPYVTWWKDDCWLTARRCMHGELSAPYVHTYEGIPDHVLAKATEVMLVGDNA